MTERLPADGSGLLLELSCSSGAGGVSAAASGGGGCAVRASSTGANAGATADMASARQRGARAEAPWRCVWIDVWWLVAACLGGGLNSKIKV